MSIPVSVEQEQAKQVGMYETCVYEVDDQIVLRTWHEFDAQGHAKYSTTTWCKKETVAQIGRDRIDELVEEFRGKRDRRMNKMQGVGPFLRADEHKFTTPHKDARVADRRATAAQTPDAKNSTAAHTFKNSLPTLETIAHLRWKYEATPDDIKHFDLITTTLGHRDAMIEELERRLAQIVADLGVEIIARQTKKYRAQGAPVTRRTQSRVGAGGRREGDSTKNVENT